jgi:hypothetical protein
MPFQMHYLSSILSFGAMQSDAFTTTSLNKQFPQNEMSGDSVMPLQQYPVYSKIIKVDIRKIKKEDRTFVSGIVCS